MSWIDEQKSESLRHWLQSTAVPLLVSSGDGRIQWCNGAFERLLGWTVAELLDPTIGNMRNLTNDPAEWKADQVMSQAVAAGDRCEYEVRKECRHKHGPPVSVVAHVLRYPMQGDFQSFLITAVPMDRGYEITMAEIVAMKSQLIELTQLLVTPAKPLHEKVLAWAKDNPTKASVIAFVTGAMIFGDRFVEVVAKAREILVP